MKKKIYNKDFEMQAHRACRRELNTMRLVEAAEEEEPIKDAKSLNGC